MKTRVQQFLQVFLWPTTLLIAVGVFGYNLALASTTFDDAPTVVHPAESGMAPGGLLPLAALVICQAIAYAIRRISPENHFLRSGWGSVAIAAVTAVLGAITPVLQTKGFHAEALAWAGLNGLLSFFTTANPNAGAPPKASIILPFVFVSAFASGCAPGADGLRQTCANANVTLTQATLTTTAVYQMGQHYVATHVTKENVDAMQQRKDGYKRAYDAFLDAMTAIRDNKATLCEAIETVSSRDIPGTITKVITLIGDVERAVYTFQKSIEVWKTAQLDYNTTIRLMGAL